MQIGLNSKSKKEFLKKIIKEACLEEGITNPEFEKVERNWENFSVYRTTKLTKTVRGFFGPKEKVIKRKEEILRVKAGEFPYNHLWDDIGWNKIIIKSAHRKFDKIASKVAQALDKKESLVTLALNLSEVFNPSERF